MKLLILGANGMVGHTIALYFTEQGCKVTGFCRRGGCPVSYVQGDARDFSRIDELILTENYDAVINCIGVLNADCDADRENAIILNSLLPVHLAKLTSEMNTRIIHISTDCVFSGAKGAYAANDIPDGTDVYSRTKALGELNDKKNLTLRTSVIGPDPDPNGKGLLNWFLQQKGTLNGYKGSVWNGLTALELAYVIEKCLEAKTVGVIQPCPEKPVTKYELLTLFKDVFGRDDIKIEPIAGIIHDKSLIPYFPGLEYEVPSYEMMLEELYSWMTEHESLYPHYRLIKE